MNLRKIEWSVFYNLMVYVMVGCNLLIKFVFFLGFNFGVMGCMILLGNVSGVVVGIGLFVSIILKYCWWWWFNKVYVIWYIIIFLC